MIIVDSRRLIKHNVPKGFDAGEGNGVVDVICQTETAKQLGRILNQYDSDGTIINTLYFNSNNVVGRMLNS